MTERYAHLAPERVRAAVDLLDEDEDSDDSKPPIRLVSGS